MHAFRHARVAVLFAFNLIVHWYDADRWFSRLKKKVRPFLAASRCLDLSFLFLVYKQSQSIRPHRCISCNENIYIYASNTFTTFLYAAPSSSVKLIQQTKGCSPYSTFVFSFFLHNNNPNFWLWTHLLPANLVIWVLGMKVLVLACNLAPCKKCPIMHLHHHLSTLSSCMEFIFSFWISIYLSLEFYQSSSCSGLPACFETSNCACMCEKEEEEAKRQ